MDVANLIRMANRIGQFFQAMPNHGEAVEGVATHIRKFWEPRMRQTLLAHVDAQGTQGMHPLVAEAVRERREQIA